jgi:DNA mismatch endonuclease, patch repair protein
VEFWKTKLETNRERDIRTQERLKELGWRILVIWECQMSEKDFVTEEVRNFLGSKGEK